VQLLGEFASSGQNVKLRSHARGNAGKRLQRRLPSTAARRTSIAGLDYEGFLISNFEEAGATPEAFSYPLDAPLVEGRALACPYFHEEVAR
jgi:hypothetical protein